MLSTLPICKNIIIKVMHTSKHQRKINTYNDMYTVILDSKSHLYMSKEWVSTKLSATRPQLIKMVQNGAGTPIDT